jgi:hypothetical protein
MKEKKKKKEDTISDNNYPFMKAILGNMCNYGICMGKISPRTNENENVNKQKRKHKQRNKTQTNENENTHKKAEKIV